MVGTGTDTELGPEELQELVDRMGLESKKYSLYLNEAKIKILTRNGEKIQITVNEKNLQQVEKFTYLGAVISDGKLEEINSRLGKSMVNGGASMLV